MKAEEIIKKIKKELAFQEEWLDELDWKEDKEQYQKRISASCVLERLLREIEEG